MDWKNKPVDAIYLIDSGLLFEINRSILHLCGLAISVIKTADGSFTFNIKDGRAAPENLIFTKEQLAANTDKLDKFMKEFGHSQMEKREAKLGRACQPVNQIRRSKNE